MWLQHHVPLPAPAQIPPVAQNSVRMEENSGKDCFSLAKLMWCKVVTTQEDKFQPDPCLLMTCGWVLFKKMFVFCWSIVFIYF